MMNSGDTRPIQFPEKNALLARLLEAVQEILGNQVGGHYLFGSLASGDFNHKSDIDYLIITSEELSAETLGKLKKMHMEFSEDDSN